MLGPEIAKRVSALTARKGITQTELAEKSGLSQSTISKVLAGMIHDPRISVVTRLADALDCHIDMLVGAKPLPPPRQVSADVLLRLERLESGFRALQEGLVPVRRRRVPSRKKQK